jgi:hypothetical protein
MNSFSPEWLQLREPADHRSRNPALVAEVARLFANKKNVRIVDLGSGLGSNLRGLAPQLPCNQQWWLLDHDTDLLGRALIHLGRWKSGVTKDDTLTLSVDGRSIDVHIETIDLAQNVASIFTDTPDLVTAAALFDLVSVEWIERLADVLAERRIPLYATLTYNGEDRGDPMHSLDAAMVAALHVHQHTDKGFGSAAGPDAIKALQKAFAARGFSVHIAPSPWRLDDNDAAMLTMLGEGVVAAVKETGRISSDDLADWQRFHMPDGRWRGVAWTVGHADLLAVPKPSP